MRIHIECKMLHRLACDSVPLATVMLFTLVLEELQLRVTGTPGDLFGHREELVHGGSV